VLLSKLQDAACLVSGMKAGISAIRNPFLAICEKSPQLEWRHPEETEAFDEF
jgi:hypothetical protein